MRSRPEFLWMSLLRTCFDSESTNGVHAAPENGRHGAGGGTGRGCALDAGRPVCAPERAAPAWRLRAPVLPLLLSRNVARSRAPLTKAPRARAGSQRIKRRRLDKEHEVQPRTNRGGVGV